MLKNKCIIITGAAGTIGTALTNYALQFQPKKLILIDNAETPLFNLEQNITSENSQETQIEYILGSITNFKLIEDILKKNKIDFIFHAAAYKHVPVIEKNPIAGVEVNILGTKTLSDLALKYAVKNFIFISTDKAVNPASVMGATKSVAEKYIKALSNNYPNKTRFIIVRFGNVIHSNGSVIPLFKEQIRKKKPLTITSKSATRYFIDVFQVVFLLIEVLKIAESGDLFLFEMGKPINIYEMAISTIKELGYRIEDVEIKIIGLRPGEKLHEDLVSKNSSLLKTKNPNIYLVKEHTDVLLNQINEEINMFYELYATNKSLETVKQLKKILKNFKSKNSKYQFLD